MKFVTFVIYDVAKAMEIAQISDKIANTPGQKRISQYLYLGNPFPGIFLQNTAVAMTLREASSDDALLAVEYALSSAGATVWSVPVWEVPAAAAVKATKKFQK